MSRVPEEIHFEEPVHRDLALMAAEKGVDVSTAVNRIVRLHLAQWKLQSAIARAEINRKNFRERGIEQ